MALAVNDIVPSATFLHAKGPQHIEAPHLRRKSAIILTNPVIKIGVTEWMPSFAIYIRNILTCMTSSFYESYMRAALRVLGSDCDCSLITLNVSFSKYTGLGGRTLGKGC